MKDPEKYEINIRKGYPHNKKITENITIEKESKPPGSPLLAALNRLAALEKEEDSLKRALRSEPTDRSFEEYMDILGVSPNDLGNDVLDLGSGSRETFSRTVSNLGINVVSVNPQLIKEQDRRKLKEEQTGLASWQQKSLAALAQALPFGGKTFDSIVSVYTVPYYLKEADYRQAFFEINRVLRKNGRAFLAPIAERDISACRSALEEAGISHYFEEIPNQLILKWLFEGGHQQYPTNFPKIFRLTILK